MYPPRLQRTAGEEVVDDYFSHAWDQEWMTRDDVIEVVAHGNVVCVAPRQTDMSRYVQNLVAIDFYLTVTPHIARRFD